MACNLERSRSVFRNPKARSMASIIAAGEACRPAFAYAESPPLPPSESAITIEPTMVPNVIPAMTSDG